MLDGLDVSKWQETTPPLGGFGFLIARASIGLTLDERYAQHAAAARAAGLVQGAYHFNWTELDPAEQARFFVKAAGPAQLLALDVEGDHAFTREQAIEFVDEVHRLGRQIGLYHSESGFFDAGQDWDWVAHWGVDAPTRAWDFHQYTSSGHVPGYDGRLDLDRFNGTADQLLALTKKETAMAKPWMHNHVSERELAHTWPDGQKDDAHWEDCMWCSVVEWLNDTWKDVPDTLAYAEKLRDAAGEPPTGGSNFTDVQRALDKLGIPVQVKPLSFWAFWDMLKPGTGAVVTGQMGNFPAGHRLRRWDASFTGGHAAEVSRMDDTDRVWWCDPLAPDNGYEGEWITKAELKTFMGSWPGSTGRALRAAPVVVPPAQGDDMPPLTSYTPGHVATVKPTSNIRSAPVITGNKPLRTLATAETWAIIGTCKGEKDPESGSDEWYVRWAGTRYEYTAKVNVTSVVNPVTAATKPLNDKITAQAGTIASLEGRVKTIKTKVAANAADVADD